MQFVPSGTSTGVNIEETDGTMTMHNFIKKGHYCRKRGKKTSESSKFNHEESKEQIVHLVVSVFTWIYLDRGV